MDEVGYKKEKMMFLSGIRTSYLHINNLHCAPRRL